MNPSKAIIAAYIRCIETVLSLSECISSLKCNNTKVGDTRILNSILYFVEERARRAVKL